MNIDRTLPCLSHQPPVQGFQRLEIPQSVGQEEVLRWVAPPASCWDSAKIPEKTDINDNWPFGDAARCGEPI